MNVARHPTKPELPAAFVPMESRDLAAGPNADGRRIGNCTIKLGNQKAALGIRVHGCRSREEVPSAGHHARFAKQQSIIVRRKFFFIDLPRIIASEVAREDAAMVFPNIVQLCVSRQRYLGGRNDRQIGILFSLRLGAFASEPTASTHTPSPPSVAPLRPSSGPSPRRRLGFHEPAGDWRQSSSRRARAAAK